MPLFFFLRHPLCVPKSEWTVLFALQRYIRYTCCEIHLWYQPLDGQTTLFAVIAGLNFAL